MNPGRGDLAGAAPAVGPRYTSALLLGALGLTLAVSVALLTSWLVRRAVKNQVADEVTRLAALVTELPRDRQGPQYVDVLARPLQADLLIVGRGSPPRVLAGSDLSETRRDLLRELTRPGLLPGPGQPVRVERLELGRTSVTLGSAPLPWGEDEQRFGDVLCVVYSSDLLAAQGRAVWLPVAGVAALGTLLAVILSVVAERAGERRRTRALLDLLVAVSHELKNPLGAIGGLARSLRPPAGAALTPGDAEDVATLELIAHEAERLTLLVDGLRHVVGPALPPNPEPVPAERAVGQLLTLLAHQLEHRRVRVEVTDLGGAVLQADPGQLRQVLLNLLQNAADAMPGGGAVRLQARTTGERWLLEVRDEGPGVAPELVPRLFQPFVTSKRQGVGVGLYLSRQLARVHGGELEYVADSGQAGACFRLSWPLARGNPTPASAVRGLSGGVQAT